MDISRGIEFDNPKIILRWGMRAHELGNSVPLSKVSEGYFTFDAIALGGRSVRVAVRFQADRLYKVELMRGDDLDLAESYRDFQDRLEHSFGEADSCMPAEGGEDGGYNYYVWKRGSVKVSHSVIDRFRLTENVVFTHLQF